MLHTATIVVLLAAWAWLSKIGADRVGSVGNPRHVPAYLTTIVVEWLMFALVIWGVRRHGVPLDRVLGPRWRSLGEVLRDIATAAAFWIVSIIVLSILARFVPAGSTNFILEMLPAGRLEIALWIAISLTAGICEETIFRGYLQGQITAMTNNVAAGIVLPSIAFGAVHSSQGVRPAVLLALYGAMFGALAHWRKTVRPGMIAHAWNDAFAGLVQGLLRP